MSVKMIVAVDRGNAIGWRDGKLPWKIPYDMKTFKEKTTGDTVLMGRTTFESLGRPAGLPNRRNVILTSDSTKWTGDFSAPVSYFGSLVQFVQVHQACLGCVPPDLWIIGGASVYTQALDLKLVDELHVTFVHELSGADVSLPFELYEWKLFILRQRAIGVEWIEESHFRPTVTDPSPGIDIVTYRKLK